jgi:hypothetical protein
MVVSNMVPVPEEVPPAKHIVDCGVPGPMPQQDADGAHGNEMHPQGFVRLVGCHDPNAEKHDGGIRSHLSAA